MFWVVKKTHKLDSIESAELSIIERRICRSTFENIDLRRAVLDWRDRHIENVELHLTGEFKVLCNALDEQIEKMKFWDLFSQNAFGKEHLEPIYKDWVGQEVTNIIGSARKDLFAVLAHALEYCEHGAASKLEALKQEESKGYYTSVAVTAAARFVAIPAVTVFSVISVVGIAGIFGLAAIGAAVAGVLLMLGVHKAASIKPRALTRYREAVMKALKEQVLGSDSDNESIRRRLQSYISNTAENIIMEIGKGNTF